VPLSLHNVSTGCTLFNSTASTRFLGGTLFSCRHSTASAFLRHFEISSLISFPPLNALACRVVAGRAGETLGLPLVNCLGRTRPKARYNVHHWQRPSRHYRFQLYLCARPNARHPLVSSPDQRGHSEVATAARVTSHYLSAFESTTNLSRTVMVPPCVLENYSHAVC
jgi:hypothetical protein